MAQVDFYLDLSKASPKIEGETTDKKYAAKKFIELDSFSVSCAQSGTQAHGSGGGAGKVRFQDIHCTKKVDTASPGLLFACAAGVHIPEATLYCRKAGTEQEEFLVWHLKDVLVSSYQCGGHGHSEILPTDQFSLNMGQIVMEYKVQDEKGKTGKPVKGGWNIKANAKADG
jgi:type VI secretion system secreted protein Hcp